MGDAEEVDMEKLSPGLARILMVAEGSIVGFLTFNLLGEVHTMVS